MARLRTFARTGGVGDAASSAWDTWIEGRLKPLAAVTSRRRIVPRTSVETTPSSELTTSGGTVRPWADHRRFNDFQVDDPGGPDPASDDE